MTTASTSLVEKVSGALAARFGRRGFFARTAVVGTAIAANPLTYALTPTDAYAAVCSCQGQNCDCGSMCCSGYTEFCCTISGQNQCPPGALLGGWWKVDGTGFCSGPRYYMDCNAPCNGCGCGANGVCSGSCSGTNCGCALGDCNNRQAGCVSFRYGQCNQQVACIGPIICRVVTCIAPWEIDGTCTTTPRYDPATASHDRPCLHTVVGDVNVVEETVAAGRNGIRVAGWALDFDTNASIDVHVYADGQWVAQVAADVARPDVAAAYPGMGPAHGYDFSFPASPGPHTVCVYGINQGPVGNSNPLLGCRSVRVGNPFGNIDGAVTDSTGVTLTGWALDPDTSAPIQVNLTADGQPVTSVTANLPRPDVAAAYPAAGPNHGFQVHVPLAPGSHTVCAYAVNVGTGTTNPSIGCVDAEVGRPFGNLETVTGGTGSYAVSGWAIDPDTSAPIQVRILTDGGSPVTITADQPRPDVGAAYPGSGNGHGFSATIPASPGVHQVTAVAVNNGAGGDTTIGTRTVEVRSSNPFGNVESVTAGPDVVRVTGWVIDPDTTGPVQVRVVVNGAAAGTGTASVSRPDVEAVYPGYGAAHGFDFTVPSPPGLVTVEVYGVNVGAGTGDTLFVTRQVLVGGNPFGNLELVNPGSGTVEVRGWAIDPDTANPIAVHVYIDGAWGGALTADQPRPDVAAAYPLYGANHGFDHTFTGLTPGLHEVCVYEINTGAGTTNPLLTCRTVSVR